ncbi:transposable element Tcb1 transposase [Trichonephila clavipes]|nr:transposable element Tcb1 transposase [Trichonephila clavipes]
MKEGDWASWRITRHMGRSDAAIRICRTPLVVIRGTLTAHRYVDGILRTVLLPFLSLYPGLIFHQDNVKPHTTHVAMNCLTSYQTLPCPARSPDPSPIEHVWDMMGRRLHVSGNVDNLTRQLEQIWQEIPQETIRDLILPRAPLGIFYMPYNHVTGPLSILCITKIYQLMTWSNLQPWVRKANDKPTTPPSRPNASFKPACKDRCRE